jgi:hypothetical protein
VEPEEEMTEAIITFAFLGIAALCIRQFVDVEIIRGRKNDRIKAWLLEGNYREGK